MPSWGGWAGFVRVFLFLLQCVPTFPASGTLLAGHWPALGVAVCCAWPAEIRPLFFPRPRWGRAEILKFGHFQPLLGHQGPARARLYPVMTLKKHLCAINFFFFPLSEFNHIFSSCHRSKHTSGLSNCTAAGLALCFLLFIKRPIKERRLLLSQDLAEELVTPLCSCLQMSFIYNRAVVSVAMIGKQQR